jgi:hypothetical protein
VTVVLDNLNTHSGASFYESCPPQEARRWLKRVEFVYTPKHGSCCTPLEPHILSTTR